MPISKILAPLLPRSRSMRLQKNKNSKSVTEFALSPAALPLSPPQQLPINENGDPIIGLSTVEEDASGHSTDTTIDAPAVTENAVVLHEKPTVFELCDNDLIIESVKDIVKEQEAQDNFEKDMMRDNTVYPINTTNTNAPEIDFAPPAEFMESDIGMTPTDAAPLVCVTEEIEPAMVALPPSPPILSAEAQAEVTECEFTAPIQAELVQSDFIQPQAIFIKPSPATPVQDIFESAKSESEKSVANFAMHTTFRRSDTVKSKWKKMLFGAKVLVCKPDRIEKNQRIKSVFDAKFENESTAAGQVEFKKSGAIDTTFVSAYDKKEDEDVKTPIYRRCNTSSTSLFQLENNGPIKPYKSPVIGSDAYNIKLLCDQSFFGRW